MFFYSNFDLKFICKSNFLQELLNFIDYIQKHFSDGSKMSLVSKIRIFGIILKLLGLRMKISNFQKKFPSSFKRHRRLQKVICFYKKIKSMSQKLSNKLTSDKILTNRGNWFWAKYVDFQNIENVKKKKEVFQLQAEVGRKVVLPGQ